MTMATQHDFNAEIYEILNDMARSIFPKPGDGESLKSRIDALRYVLPVESPVERAPE